MARIVYNEQRKDKSTAPNWIDVEGLNKASAEEAKITEEMLSKIASNKEQVVISWANPGKGKIYQSSDRRLQDQERIAIAAGKTVKLTDPDTGEELVPYKTALLPVKAENLKHSESDLRPEGLVVEGTYTNTYVDRHVQYKALEALRTFAMKCGMALPRVRYIKGDYSQQKVASGDLVTFSDIHTEIEWVYGRNQKARIFCKASIDPAGKIEMPKVFKIASGETYEFSKDNIEALQKDSTFREMMTIKPKKTDIPTFRRPDISNFMAVSSLNKEAVDPTAQAAFPAQQQVPQANVQVQNPGQYIPGTTYTNPVDNKMYVMKSYDPNKGAIVTSPEGQDMAVPANEVPNLKPNVKTQGALEFSIEKMADDLIMKHLREDMKQDKEQAAALHEIGDEETREARDDQEMIDKLTIGAKNDPPWVKKKKEEEAEDKKPKTEKPDVKPVPTKKTADIIDGIDNTIIDPESPAITPEQLPGEEPFNNPEITPEPFSDGALTEPTPEAMPDGPLPGEGGFPMDEDASMLELPDGSGAMTGTVGFDNLPKLKVVSKEKERVQTMAKRWSELRKIIAEEMEKAPVEGDELPFEEAPEKISREQQEVQRLRAVGYKGFSPLKNDANEQGRDPKTHVPTKSSGDVEIGMTDFPDYTKPFQEAQREMVEQREHFHNENRLGLRGLRRNELNDYVDGKKDEKNYGLSEEGRDGKEFKNPDPFRKKASTDEDIANALINKTAADEEGKVEERPTVHKNQLRAPGLEGWKEPEVIPEAESKVKEAITKFRKVQVDITATKEKLQAAIAPIQKQLIETQKPYQEDLKKGQESLSTYLEMIYSQLSEVENKIVAYEDKIFAVVERSKDETAKVSLAQLLDKLEKETPEIFAAVQKVKEAMENEHVTSVLERFLYEYPVSKEHEKKKVVRKSGDEDGSFKEALRILKDALMSLLNLEATLGVA